MLTFSILLGILGVISGFRIFYVAEKILFPLERSKLRVLKSCCRHLIIFFRNESGR